MVLYLSDRNDDTRLMDFVLMRLRFFDGNTGESADTPPIFEHVTEFKTRGVVMNVFLLDPIARLLSAFIYAGGTSTICLYALLDWDKPEYIFIDTGIECVSEPINRTRSKSNPVSTSGPIIELVMYFI